MTTSQARELLSVAIIERDRNADVRVVWAYPGVDDAVREVVLSRSFLTSEAEVDRAPSFLFSRFGSTWIYQAVARKVDPAVFGNVSQFAIVVCANDFDPEKYQALLRLFGIAYLSSADPLSVLRPYLSVFTTAKCKLEGIESGSFDASSFDARRAFLASPISAVVKRFGPETILLWNAVMLRKRIVVFSHQVADLLQFTRSLPLLAWHRQNWGILRPYVTITEPEIRDLKATGVYIAGTTDTRLSSRSEMYDLLVDLSEDSIVVADHARDDFALSSMHKDVAKLLLETAEQGNDQAVIKSLALKTREIIGKLESLGTPLSFEKVRQDAKPQLARFLMSLAQAEGMEIAA